MIKVLKRFLNDEIKLSRKNFVALMFGMAVCGGIFGMIYETLFYVLNNGGLCRRGTCFGPWIEIYGIGALFIYLIANKLNRKPWAVFLVSGVVCGIIEYVAGYAIYNIFDGRRGWNYNTEIWNWGNIDGFVCARSVLVFASAGLMLMYVIIPFLLWVMEKIGEKLFFIIAMVLGSLFLIDVIYNDIIVSIFDTYSAGDLYKNIGWYMYYNEDKLI